MPLIKHELTRGLLPAFAKVLKADRSVIVVEEICYPFVCRERLSQ